MPEPTLLIRAETAADYTDIDAINRLAFGRENEARLIERVRHSKEFILELSLVAEHARRSVGHILFSSICIRTAERVMPALALAPLAVHPEWQNQGVGSALVRRGLQACRRLGHGIVIVVGHPKYYPRFGFSSARAMGLEAPFPDAAFMAQALRPGALHGIRGAVEYPPAFADV